MKLGDFNKLVTPSGPNVRPLFVHIPVFCARPRTWMVAINRVAINRIATLPYQADYDFFVASLDEHGGAYVSHATGVSPRMEELGVEIPGVNGEAYAEVRREDRLYRVTVHVGDLLLSI